MNGLLIANVLIVQLSQFAELLELMQCFSKYIQWD